MNEKQTTFLEKMKALPAEDLLKYKSAAIQAKRILDVLGIACILTMLVFPIALVLVPCIPLAYILAKTSSNINLSLIEITNLLQQRTKS